MAQFDTARMTEDRLADRLFIGVDAGSSVMKAGLYDAKGALLAVASRPTPRTHPQAGWVEMNPDACLTAFDAVLSELVAGCSDPAKIAALGISAAMVGAWLLDGQGKCLRPGINWEDSRSQSMLDAMQADQPSLYSDIFQVSGSVLQQGCTLPVLAWLRDNEADIFAKAVHCVTYKDVLRHHLTGTIASDRSEAAVTPGDARSQDHSPTMREMFGLKDHAALFAPALASNAVAGTVTKAAATRTGLPEAIPVVAGAGDVIANLIGAGGLLVGSATAILGTTCMVGAVHDAPVFTPPDLGLLFSLPERHWYRAMVNVAGTSNLDWALSMVAPELLDGPDRFERLTDRVAKVPPGANGVTYLPYLSESGIIAPVADPKARAQFSGLNASHRPDDLLRAVMEGVAFAIDDLIALLDLPDGAPVTLAGGGARNPLWVQMIADVCGHPIRVPDGEELGAKGAAILAASALTPGSSISDVATPMTSGGSLHNPAQNAADIWRKPKAQYVALRDLMLAP